MAKENAKDIEKSGNVYEAKPTDAELQEHIDSKRTIFDEHVIQFVHLSPQRTRVIAVMPPNAELDEMARKVALEDRPDDDIPF